MKNQMQPESFESFYGLAENPFALTPDPRFLFRSKVHHDVLQAVISGLETEKGIIAIIGTTNFDIRSFALHDELSVVFYDRAMAAETDATFALDAALSAEITLEDIQAVSRAARMRNALARLSSRLL